MTLREVVVLLLVLAGPALLWHRLYADKSGVTPCIGCGECIATGKCTMAEKGVRKRAKKPASCLDKDDKKDIMISVKE